MEGGEGEGAVASRHIDCEHKKIIVKLLAARQEGVVVGVGVF